MNKTDTIYFKDRLEKEKKVLEDELNGLGKKTSGKAGVWEASSDKMEVDTADDNEVADKMEELEENELILEQLEKQLSEVTSALDRINEGTYGICEISKKDIERERLEANPSARTCMEHMK